MSDELRPCPFCGNKDIQRYDYVNGKFRVTCWDCRNTTKDWDGVDDAIEKWNTRVDPSPKWTYCEDALPETNGWYLISTFNGMVTHCEFSVRDGFYTYLKVIAWMPKPTPAEPKEAK